MTITWTAANADAGAGLRKLARQINKLAANVPDTVTTGASTVLTIDNAPSSGKASVQITGPYAAGPLLA